MRAAEAFQATLSAGQRDTVVRELTLDNADNWSNFPHPVVVRNGLKLGDLSAPQREAALAVARAALSEAGFATFQGVRAADEFLGRRPTSQPNPPGTGQAGSPPAGVRPPGGPPGGRPRVTFDSDVYFIAFLGAPSATGRWILQLGGHHYAMNLAFGGPGTSPTPFHVGVEPRTFTLDGTTYAPMAERARTMTALLAALPSAQTETARIPGSFRDILLGPGSDFQFPARQGVSVSSLAPAQRALVTDAIRAWVADMDQETADRFLAKYTAAGALDSTNVGYAGATDLETQGAYVRIDGPGVWIEISAQQSNVDKVHYHSIWRDKQLDYGGLFASAGRAGGAGSR